MNLGLLFWIIMLVGLVLGLYNNRVTPMVWVGNSLVLWILIAILGWGIFGPAIHR